MEAFEHQAFETHLTIHPKRVFLENGKTIGQFYLAYTADQRKD